MTDTTDHVTQHFKSPDTCPYCGSGDIDGQSVNIQEQTTTQRLNCTKCRRHWHDLYRLDGLIDDRNQHHQRPVPQPEPVGAPPSSLTDRDMRQRDIVPPEALANCTATIIGVGAIGRQVALQLAALGVPRMHLFDPQIVEPVNLAAQGYLEQDLGCPKVEATARLCARINSSIAIEPVAQRFRRFDDVGNCAFVCVDSIETRAFLWPMMRRNASFYVDGRMSAEVVRVLSVAHEQGREHYADTFFTPAEAHVGPCTGRSTIYTANIAAGLMIEQFTRWLRRLPVDIDMTLNLLTSEMSVMSPAGTG